jgi:hypothetical protein
MSFKCPEITDLFEQVRPWCHPEYPFLDARYSPGSKMPAIDYTPHIAAWLQSQKIEAVRELLGFLIGESRIRDTILDEWLGTPLVTWLGLPTEAVHEIHAIGLMISRQAIDRSINKDSLAHFAAQLIATRLSLHQATITENYKVLSGPSTAPDEDDDFENITGLLLETQTRLAYGLRQWRDGNNEGASMAFPAQELTCFGGGDEAAEWPQIWDEAVSQLGERSSATKARNGGRMVARKNDPVWLAISEFGRPYPPFKLGSDMSVMDVGYEEAVTLKVVRRNESSVAVEPRIVKAAALPDELSAKLRSNLRPELLNSLEEPIAQEALVIERLALVPPMTRLVVTDYFTRSWAQGQMKFSMGYREREYGCCFDWNKHYVNWLDFFEPPCDLASVPHTLKKDQIRSRLEAAGVQTKKSMSRENLLTLAAQNPSLLTAMVGEFCPEACVVKQQWKAPLDAWLARYQKSLDAASEVYKTLLVDQMLT